MSISRKIGNKATQVIGQWVFFIHTKHIVNEDYLFLSHWKKTPVEISHQVILKVMLMVPASRIAR